MTRVLLYSHFFSPGSGGLATFSDSLAANLHDLGITVRLATATPNTASVHRPWPVHWAVSMRELVRLCRWSDVIHMNGFRATVVAAAWLARRPVVWTHHEYSYCPTGLGWWRGNDRAFALPQCWSCLRDRGFDKRSAARRILATVGRRLSNRLVTAHTTTTAYMKDRLNLPTATVITLGARRLNVGQPSASDAPGVFTVVYAGRLIPEKGVDVAIRAIAEARRLGSNVRLEIVGGGPDRPALERLALQELPDTAVTFSGEVGPDAALDRIRVADAVIVPSVWSEPAGYVVIEAMASGVPVIAADVGGIPEIARGAALLVARSDVEGFAHAVNRLTEDRAVARMLIDRGTAAAQTHTDKTMAEEYRTVYLRALESGPRRRFVLPRLG